MDIDKIIKEEYDKIVNEEVKFKGTPVSKIRKSMAGVIGGTKMANKMTDEEIVTFLTAKEERAAAYRTHIQKYDDQIIALYKKYKTPPFKTTSYV